MSAERRLDDAVAALGRARPQLDEITRARIGARVEAELARDATRTPTVAPRRRWPVAALAVGGGLAVAVAAIVWRVAADRPTPVAPPLAGTATPPPLTGPIDVAAGESRQVALGDATITVFGPGRLEGTRDRANAEAAAVVIDRPRGETPMTLGYAGVEVIVTRATFALDRGHGVRVTVMRGELTLRCADQPRLVRAGESAACTDDTAARATAAATDASAIAALPLPAAPPTPAAPSAALPAPATLPAPRPRAPSRVATAPSTPVAELPPPVDVPPTPATPPPAPDVPPPDAVPTPPPPGPEPIATSAAPDLYPLAEGAMRRGDLAGARAALQAVIAADPASLDAAVALLDLARLAHQRHDSAAARAYLDRLAVHPRRATVAAPAARLRAELDRHR